MDLLEHDNTSGALLLDLGSVVCDSLVVHVQIVQTPWHTFPLLWEMTSSVRVQTLDHLALLIYFIRMTHSGMDRVVRLLPAVN